MMIIINTFGIPHVQTNPFQPRIYWCQRGWWPPIPNQQVPSHHSLVDCSVQSGEDVIQEFSGDLTVGLEFGDQPLPFHHIGYVGDADPNVNDRYDMS